MSGLASVFQSEKFHSIEFEGARESPPWLFLHSHLSEPWQVSGTHSVANGHGTWAACGLHAGFRHQNSRPAHHVPTSSDYWSQKILAIPELVTETQTQWPLFVPAGGLQPLCKFKPFKWALASSHRHCWRNGEGGGSAGKSPQGAKRMPTVSPFSPHAMGRKKAPK